MDDIPASSIVVNDNGDPFRGIGPCIFDQFMNYNLIYFRPIDEMLPNLFLTN